MVKLKNTGESGDFELIPAGEVISARLTDVEMRKFVWDGEEVEKLKWVFTVTEQGPWIGKDVFGDTSTVFTAHPNCKAYNWATAITGKQFGPDESLDTDDLIGMPARIMIRHKKPDSQGRIWMRVGEVLPPRAGSAQRPEEAPF